MTGRLVGVGVGPGDPELVTVKAVRRMREADVVFVPVAAPATGVTERGRAEAVVLAHLGPEAVTRLVFSLDPAEQARDRSWAAPAAAVAASVADGKVAAFATIGDPGVYSTFTYLADRVRALVPGVAVEVVPGITAMQDLAARSGIPLVAGDESLVLLPLLPGAGGLPEALAAGGTVVCYKGGARLPEVLGIVRDAGRLEGAVYGARLGLPGEEVRPASEMAGRRGPYLSTVIVPADRRDGRLARGGAGAR